jgi:hypothetical protein
MSGIEPSSLNRRANCKLSDFLRDRETEWLNLSVLMLSSFKILSCH